MKASGNVPRSRVGHGFAARGLKLFVYGGDVESSDVSPVSDMYEYSTESGVWTAVFASGDLPLNRVFPGFVSIDNFLLVHGGLLSADLSAASSKVAKYGPSLKCFKQCQPGAFLTSTATGSTTCLSCPAGTFTAEYGQRSCDSCPSGVWSAIASTVCT